MGFEEVYDYVDGKVDWMGAGLPTEGTNTQRPRGGDIARKDTPTCRLDEKLGDVAARVRAAGWAACVVVNDERVVMGLLRERELGGDPEQRIETAMRPGPSTFRPYEPVSELAKFMSDHSIESSPITTSDGRLVGLVLRADVEKASQLR